jgi:hypothetical protein
MPDPDNFFFWPVVVLLGIVLVVLSVRFLIKLALFIVALLVIWYCLAYVGLVPPPADYFHEEKKTLETATVLLYKDQAWGACAIKKFVKTDRPQFGIKSLRK